MAYKKLTKRGKTHLLQTLWGFNILVFSTLPEPPKRYSPPDRRAWGGREPREERAKTNAQAKKLGQINVILKLMELQMSQGRCK
jgi:hypothetical protein